MGLEQYTLVDKNGYPVKQEFLNSWDKKTEYHILGVPINMGKPRWNFISLEWVDEKPLKPFITPESAEVILSKEIELLKKQNEDLVAENKKLKEDTSIVKSSMFEQSLELYRVIDIVDALAEKE